MADYDIRLFEPQDVTLVVKMGWFFHNESPVYSRLTYDPHKARDWLLSYTDPNARHERCGWTASKDGELAGGLMAFTYEQPWCTGKMSCDVITFLAPSHRGGGAASALIREYVSWAKQNDVKIILLASSCDVNQDRASGCYAKNGFVQIGTEVMYEE